jgi:hypothetical protein
MKAITINPARASFHRFLFKKEVSPENFPTNWKKAQRKNKAPISSMIKVYGHALNAFIKSTLSSLYLLTHKPFSNLYHYHTPKKLK